MQKLSLSIFILALLFSPGLYAQGISGNVVIANERDVGSDYYFDLYLTTDAGSNGDIFLADADFRVEFDHTVFNSPTFHKRDSNVVVGTAPFTLNLNIGYCSFMPSNNTTGNTLLLQDEYHTSMALSMPEPNVLSIEIPGIAPSDINQLNDGVAKIDNQQATHRLGRFYISGFNGTGNPNLSISLTGVLSTKVFTYGSAPSFPSTSVDLSAATFPVEWLDFTAEKTEGGAVRLNWTTGSEINNDYFSVQKRLEEGEFETIDQVSGAGYSDQPLYYEYVDEGEMGSVVAYRLQQVDFDGTSDFSDIVEVHFDELGTARYAVYPNPATELLNVEIIAERDQDHQYSLRDLRGRTVQSGQIAAGTNVAEINVSDLASGTYLLQLKNAKGQPINLKVSVK
ncbi:MAG: T9SS type A sorting domain-containing protein [Bacteroidota bacterium]